MADSMDLATRDASLRRFAELLGMPEDQYTLFDHALLLTGIEKPDLRAGWWYAWEGLFAQVALQIRDDLGAIRGQGDPILLKAWADYFAHTMHFRAPTGDYYAPTNSSLVHCLERRTGLPITLSVLFVELGRAALGLDLFGVGTPGHFIAGARMNGGLVFVDPFAASGDVMGPDAAAIAVGERTGRPADSVHPFLRPATRAEILGRMLKNLRNAYERLQAFGALARSLEWMMVLDPSNVEAQRDRGLALLRCGDLDRGARQLLAFVAQSPEAQDLEVIRREALRALATRHSLN
jgi:regulator of sirC expression with transglutaminase-like and TPR domain